MTERGRRHGVPVLVAVVTAVLVVGVPVPAAAATGALSGRVVDGLGIPVPDTEIYVEGPSDSGWGYTDSDGAWQIDGLNLGGYTVRFDPPYNSGLLPEFSSNARLLADADLAVVRVGDITTGVNARLEKGGRISGAVTGPTGGAVGNTRIRAESLTGDPWPDLPGNEIVTTQSALDGTWEVIGLMPGDYRVGFGPSPGSLLAAEWHADVVDPALATPLPVGIAGNVIGIDAELALGGTISGHVTGPGGAPVANVAVVADPTAELGDGVFFARSHTGPLGGTRTAVTDHTGAYTLTGLTAGPHTLAFDPGSWSGLAPEFYNDAVALADADPVDVPAGGAVTGIDAQLALPGAIAGTVTDPRGAPVAGVDVVVLDLSKGFAGSASTALDGTYTVDRLLPRDHMMVFVPPEGIGLNREVHADGSTLATPTPVPVTAAATTVVDVELADCAAPAAFTDVAASSAFCTPIDWMVGAGITTGFGDGSFRPTAGVTRQAVVAFLHRVAGAPGGPFPDPGFPDVPPTHPFHLEISWAADEGIVTGYADGEFHPDAVVTRQAMASFLWKLVGAPATTDGVCWDDFWPPFDDVGCAHPFLAPIIWITSNGIASGYADDTFRPSAPISRQAIASFLYGFHFNGWDQP